MRLSVDIPTEWSEAVKDAARKSGARSVRDYILSLIAINIGEIKPQKAWGGKHKQVEQDTHDEQLEQDDALEPPKARPGPSRVLNANELLAQRKADAAKKFQR